MAWVELIPVLMILALVAWIFLRPYPGDADKPVEPDTDSRSNDRDDSP